MQGHLVLQPLPCPSAMRGVTDARRLPCASQVLVFMRRHQGMAAGESELRSFASSLAWSVAFGKGREQNFGILAMNNIQADEDSLDNVQSDPASCVSCIFQAAACRRCLLLLDYTHMHGHVRIMRAYKKAQVSGIAMPVHAPSGVVTGTMSNFLPSLSRQ
jgi:hypothetical protein